MFMKKQRRAILWFPGPGFGPGRLFSELQNQR
jgi:hypothetical protein